MSLIPSPIRAIWRKLAYTSVDPAGPGGAFARAVSAARRGVGLTEVVEEDDVLELLARALVPGHPNEPLLYPGWHQVEEANKVEGFAAGLGLLGAAVRERLEWSDGDDIEVDLLVGTLMPIPGSAERRPMIDEVHTDEEGDEARFARVEYTYEGDAAGHALHFYRDGAGVWLLDVVWELARAGAMQAALGNVQGTGCPTEKLEV